VSGTLDALPVNMKNASNSETLQIGDILVIGKYCVVIDAAMARADDELSRFVSIASDVDAVNAELSHFESIA